MTTMNIDAVEVLTAEIASDPLVLSIFADPSTYLFLYKTKSKMKEVIGTPFNVMLPENEKAGLHPYIFFARSHTVVSFRAYMEKMDCLERYKHLLPEVDDDPAHFQDMASFIAFPPVNIPMPN